MIERFLTLIPLLAELWEGIKIEVYSVKFVDNTAKPGDSVVLISPHLVAYRVRLRISNSSQKHIGLKSVVLSINRKAYKLDDYDFPESLNPGESRLVSMPFSCEEGASAEGKYVLSIVDARGRKISMSGQFPIEEK